MRVVGLLRQFLGGKLPDRVAERAQGFPARGRGQPRSDTFGILQATQVLDQAKPGRLHHVGGVRRGRRWDRATDHTSPLYRSTSPFQAA